MQAHDLKRARESVQDITQGGVQFPELLRAETTGVSCRRVCEVAAIETARTSWSAVISAALILSSGVHASQSNGVQPSTSGITGPAVVRPGDVAVLTFDCHCEAISGSARTLLVGRAIPLSHKADSSLWQALVGIDLERRPGTYVVTMTLEGSSGQLMSVTHGVRVETRDFPTRHLKVDPGFVNPPAGVQARIASEAALLEKVLSGITPGAFDPTMQAPVQTTPSSSFGARSIFNGQPRSPHAGVDFSGSVGTPIVAPGPATVAVAQDLYFTGLTVVLDHGHGLFSILAHLSRIGVEPGAQVARGDVVGLLGATGRVTGPHLHWGMRLLGARIDPLSALRVLDGG